MKRIVLLGALCMLSGVSLKARELPPPSFVWDIIIHQITGVLQHNEMIVSNDGEHLKFRMSKRYEIFNKKSKLVLKGSGKEVDIKELPKGKYTVRFDGDANQVESFEK